MNATFDSWLPLLILSSSLFTGLVIFTLRDHHDRARYMLNLFGATVKLVLVAIIVIGDRRGNVYESRLPLIPGIDLIFQVNPISLAFLGLSALLWWVTTLYAIGYFEGSPRQNRFFGFFSLCVTATMGIALAGNPITFFIFYEMLTLVTYPLVIHSGTTDAIKAGRTYLVYTLSGGVLMLFGIIWLHVLAGPVEFQSGGVFGVLTHVSDREPELIVIFALLMIGLGVKSAIVPLHVWLPGAMVAPAPVSALLHAVAVVKAGAYGILRFIYDLYGVPLAGRLGVLGPLGVAAAFTIVYGSARALTQKGLKARLAYSTVSQVSYIILGAAIIGPLAVTAAVAHLMHQGLMKITLFYCAGIFAETLGIHRVDELNGVGKRMPLTMAAFTIGAFGMMGLPPTAGFVTKWYLGTGALAAGDSWVIVVLAMSTVLNAAYFLPIVYAGWFKEPNDNWTEKKPAPRYETSFSLLMPAVLTAAISLLAGVFAGAPFSPLELASQIAEDLYRVWLS